MSLFDPHGLYRKNSYYTNKGQIIRQKDIDRPGIIKKSEIPRSLQVLQTYGYTVYPPGHVSDPTNYFQIGTFTRQFSLDDQLTDFSFSLSNIWPTIYSSFSDILSYDPSKVTVQFITFGLTSIFLGFYPQSNTTVNFLFYNNSTLMEFPDIITSSSAVRFYSVNRIPGNIACLSNISNFSYLSVSDSFPQTFISYFRCDDSYSQLKNNDIEDDYFLFDIHLDKTLNSSQLYNYVVLNLDVFISIFVSE